MHQVTPPCLTLPLQLHFAIACTFCTTTFTSYKSHFYTNTDDITLTLFLTVLQLASVVTQLLFSQI